MNRDQKFKKRQNNLITRQVDNELLVYDDMSYQGYCFNETMKLIWQNMDDETTPAGVLNKLVQEGVEQVDESVVLDVCNSLLEYGLIEALTEQQPIKLTRRSLVKGAVGMGSITIAPVITMLSIPSAYAQASCTPNGGACTSNADCCPGCVCGGGGGGMGMGMGNRRCVGAC